MIGNVYEGNMGISVKLDANDTWSKLSYNLPISDPSFPYATNMPHDFMPGCGQIPKPTPDPKPTGKSLKHIQSSNYFTFRWPLPREQSLCLRQG